MRTLNRNYQRNVEIMRENIKRGMTVEVAAGYVRSMRNVFKAANRYGEDEAAFISDMIAEISGFDYKNQAWVQNGVYVRCGHPDDMDCNCYGKEHEGETCELQ